jgi:YHS domain-containing protein
MHPHEASSRAYLQAFYRGDVAVARAHLADDLAFVGPSATLKGAEAFLRLAAHVAPGVKAVDVHRVFVDGDELAIFYDLALDHRVARVPVAEWHVFREDRIASIRLLLDTAPFAARPTAPEDRAIDPVCHMEVVKSDAAATRIHGGATYYFCNAGCAEAFEREPAQYAAEPQRA